MNERVTVRRDGIAEGRCVVYWMQRAQRAIDNPALDVAIDAANQMDLPVVVFLGLVPHPQGNLRHFQFLLDGISDLAERLRKRRVGFVFRRWPRHRLEPFLDEVRPALVVGDENSLRVPNAWREKMARRLRVPLWTVDADVIVPSKLLLKEQYAARTIRPRIQRELERFLVHGHEPVAKRVWPNSPPLDLSLEGFRLDRSVAPVEFRGGSTEGLRRLRAFVRERLHGYHQNRNHPDIEGTSRLSPYLHFGQLGPRQIALAVREADAPLADKNAFLEELIVRRELAVNFVRYNSNYDRLDGCEPWARATLSRHRRDRRLALSDDQLEFSDTPDPLWNAAQKQMVEEGWMHGYLRMYWAKKILEWSATPEEAFARAIALNDKYELDGRDPNGYTGIAWALGGKHDRAWGERAVFGKIRYMSHQSTSKKFDARAYEARHA